MMTGAIGGTVLHPPPAFSCSAEVQYLPIINSSSPSGLVPMQLQAKSDPYQGREKSSRGCEGGQVVSSVTMMLETNSLSQSRGI